MAMPNLRTEQPIEAPARRVGSFRWVICGLLFLAATINYVDRQVIGILKPTLQTEFGWSEIDYSDIVFAFQRVFYGQVDATTTTNGVTTTVHVLIPVSVGFLAVLLTCVTLGSIVLLWLAWRAYFLMSGDFAEEL